MRTHSIITRQESAMDSAPVQKEEVWSKVGHTEKARQVLGNELIRALDAPLASHLNDEGSDEHDDKSQSAQALKDRHTLQADLTGISSRLLTFLLGFLVLQYSLGHSRDCLPLLEPGLPGYVAPSSLFFLFRRTARHPAWSIRSGSHQHLGAS